MAGHATHKLVPIVVNYDTLAEYSQRYRYGDESTRTITAILYNGMEGIS